MIYVDKHSISQGIELIEKATGLAVIKCVTTDA